MSVVVVLGGSSEGVRFGASPLAELVSAAHVLDDPSHHPHAGWAHRVRATLPPELTEGLARFGLLWGAFRARMFLPTAGSVGASLSAELADLAATPTDVFVQLAVHAVRGGGPVTEVESVRNDDGLRRRAMTHARARGPVAVELMEDLLEDPERVRVDLCDFLAACATSFFGDLWREVSPVLVREARQRNEMLRRFGATSTLVGALSSAREGVAGDTVVIDKVHDGRIDVRSTRLVVVPTVLGRPHLVVKDEGGEPAIQYPVLDPRERPHPPLDLQRRRMQALSDPVCLQLCRDISREARSTLQLADRWRLDPAIVSRHLKALHEADLVDTDRRGHFVLYRLRTSEVGRVGDDLLTALLR